MTSRSKSSRVIAEMVKRILSESVYDSEWITELGKAFNAKVSVDKRVNHKTLYGGGDIDQIGFDVILNEPIGNISGFILEGLRFNDVFLHSGILTYDSNERAIMHGTLNYSVHPRMQVKENIEIVINAINKKIKK